MTTENDLKSLQFAAVLQSVEDDASQSKSVGDALTATLSKLSTCVPLLVVLTGVVSAALVLLWRPPFALVFHVDRRRPWLARSSVSWAAVTVVAVVSAVLVGLIPYAWEATKKLD